MKLRFSRTSPTARAPTAAHAGDAGHDLYADEDHELPPGGRTSVGTGIVLEIPAGRAGLVLPRSGLAARHGIALVNSPGLIDPGYRGELRVLLLNTDRERSFEVRRGHRIAQLVIVAVDAPELVEAHSLEPSARGTGGFGSSGD